MSFIHGMFLLAADVSKDAKALEGTSHSGMLFACWAIFIVLLAMVVVFLRSGKKEYAVAILPLLIVPFMHIFSCILSSLLSGPLPFTAAELRIMIDLTAGLVSCLLLGFASLGIEGRRTRNAFFWCCAGFVVILTLVLVTNTMVLVSSAMVGVRG